jgi:outer membrane protein assembly factor BamB
VRSSPATSGGVLFFGSNDKRVYALNASTGAHLWNYTTAGIVYSTPAVSSGLVVFGSYDNRVYALNASTGTYIWNYTTSGGVWSSPAVSGNAVYVGSNDRKIYALNLSTGALIWSTTTGFDVVSSPAVSQELVFAGSKDDVLWGLDRGNGSVLWNINLGTDLVSSPAIAGGMVFTGADDGRVYAFGLYNDTTPPNISLIWPENGSTDSDGNLTLVYKVSDEGSNISSCALSLNGLLNQTSPNILENVNQSFSAYNLVNGSYNWSVSCTDESVNLNVGESPTWHFNVSINPLINFLDDLSSGWNLLSIPVAIQG